VRGHDRCGTKPGVRRRLERPEITTFAIVTEKEKVGHGGQQFLAIEFVRLSDWKPHVTLLVAKPLQRFRHRGQVLRLEEERMEEARVQRRTLKVSCTQSCKGAGENFLVCCAPPFDKHWGNG
jgi:hypothetical protein